MIIIVFWRALRMGSIILFTKNITVSPLETEIIVQYYIQIRRICDRRKLVSSGERGNVKGVEMQRKERRWTIETNSINGKTSRPRG